MRLNRAFKVSLFFLTFLAATASHAFNSKAFVAPPGESIKTIGLLKVGEPRGYFLGEGGGRITSYNVCYTKLLREAERQPAPCQPAVHPMRPLRAKSPVGLNSSTRMINKKPIASR